LLLCLFAPLSFATITVGYTNWNGVATSTVSTVSTVSGTTQATGSTFIVLVSARQTTAPTSIAGTIGGVADGNTYTLAKGVTGYSGVYLYYCINCNGGSAHIITATWAATSANATIGLVEFEGVGAGTFDTAPTGVYNTSGSTTETSPSITTSVANELVVDVIMMYSAAFGETITDSGTGFSIAVQASTSGTVNNGAISWAVPASSSTATADTFNFADFDYTGNLALAIKPYVAVVTNGVVISNGHPVNSNTSILYK
jgi:hypothetical protein